jgi:hypothetical protein
MNTQTDKSNSQMQVVLPAFIVLLLISTNAVSADIEAALTAGVGHTDNLGRSFDNQISEEMAVAGLSFDLTEETRKLDAYIRSNFQYVYYDLEDFDDEVVGGLEAVIDYSFVENRFNWSILNNYGQRLQDPFLPDQPGNRENINFFSTGPSFHFPMGDRHRLTLSGLYSDVRYEESPFDNTGLSVAGAFRRDLREDQALSLNAILDTTEYDDEELAGDFDRREYFARFQSLRGRDEIEIDLGQTELRFEDLETNSGPLIRFFWRRALSTVSNFEFNAGSDHASQQDRLRYLQSNQNEIGETVDLEGAEGDVPFRNNYVAMTYDYARERTVMVYRLEWTQQDFEGRSDLDRDVGRANVTFRRAFTQRLFGQLEFQFARREYTGLLRTDNDSALSAMFGVHLGTKFTLSLQYLYFRRNSNLDTDEFTENRVFLALTFVPGWASRPARIR